MVRSPCCRRKRSAPSVEPGVNGERRQVALAASASAAATGLRELLAELEKMAHVEGWESHVHRLEQIKTEFTRVAEYVTARAEERQEP